MRYVDLYEFRRPEGDRFDEKSVAYDWKSVYEASGVSTEYESKQ